MIESNTLNIKKGTSVNQLVTIDMVYESLKSTIEQEALPIVCNKDEIVFRTGMLGLTKTYLPCVTLTHSDKALANAYWTLVVSAQSNGEETIVSLATSGRSALDYLRKTDGGNNIFVRFPHYLKQWKEECEYYELVKALYNTMFC